MAATTLAAPFFSETVTTRAGDEIEVVCVPATKLVARELRQVFPTTELGDVVVVTTCQRCAVELVNWGDEAAKEKDRLLEAFVAFAKDVCAALAEKGHWADYVDPCSGLPAISKDTPTVYDEVAGMQSLLKYDVHDAGPCKILMHPRWGSAVYPATMFTNAPSDVVVAVLEASSASR